MQNKPEANTGKPPAYYAWQRLKRNRTAYVSLLFIAFCSLISVLGYLISPDSTPNANDQQIELETLKPGSEITILKIRKNQPEIHINILEKMLYGAPGNNIERPISGYYISGDKIIVQPIHSSDKKDAETYLLADVVYDLKDSNVTQKNGFVTFETYSGQQTFFVAKVLINRCFRAA
ncbi:MAG: hypothetical protein EOP53_23060, partial [Sphingobacteriales bacterium]